MGQIQATSHRITAKWHLQGQADGDRIKIERIWRDDDRQDFRLAWRAEESDGRVVQAVYIGPPDRTQGSGLRFPCATASRFKVSNPKGIFDYHG